MPEEIPEVVTERPEGLPEKFADVAALAASYKELEQKQSSPPPAEITPKVEPAIEESTQFNINDYYKEYADNGELSPESYEALDAKGLDRDQVTRIIQLENDNRSAQAEAQLSKYEGGSAAYNSAIAWARDNLDTAYHTEFNAGLNAGPRFQDEMITDLLGKWKEAGGEVSVEQGSNVDGVPSAGGAQLDTFANQGEMVAVMNSPQYKGDHEYRAKMEAKMLRSKF